VQARLNTDINKILQRPEARSALLAQGLEPSPLTSDEFGALIRADIQKSREVISSAGIKVE
jgi:tripartite-type tricarboxylate transporter receptor subunit TctC